MRHTVAMPYIRLKHRPTLVTKADRGENASLAMGMVVIGRDLALVTLRPDAEDHNKLSLHLQRVWHGCIGLRSTSGAGGTACMSGTHAKTTPSGRPRYTCLPFHI